MYIFFLHGASVVINNMIFNKKVIRNVRVERIMDASYKIVVETNDQDYYPETCTSLEYANELIKKIFAQLNETIIVDGYKIEIKKEK